MSFALGRLFSRLEIFSVKKEELGRGETGLENKANSTLLVEFSAIQCTFSFVRVPNVWSITQSRTQASSVLSQR